ncbi:MAG: glycosyltransferase family 4 protein [Acidimicrobiales bacterium]|nr:glycosyltransferase family 4 protein [Acidimicrobiales bacterium]
MRVAVIVEQFWHPVPGGTGRATHKTIRALQRAGGVELVGIAARHGDQGSGPDADSHDLTIPVVQSRLPRPLLYEGWLRLGRPRTTRLAEPLDVVWASAMVPPPASSVPMVSTVHDLEFLDHPEWNSARGRTFFPRAFAATMKRSQIIVTPSQHVADRCVRAGIPADRLRVVPWGVSKSRVHRREVDEVRANYDLPDRFVLWVGTLEPRKNLAGLVQAMATVDAPLVVVGPDGWASDGTDILRPLGDRCHRLGRVSDRDLHLLYAAASVFAFPSHAEGFGLPVLEAMAQGTPVVTSSGTATAEAAGGAALLVNPADPEAIAAALNEVLQKTSLAEELRVKGLARASEMSWDRTAVGYLEAFRSAHNRRGSRD